jgi:hypothetical protein
MRCTIGQEAVFEKKACLEGSGGGNNDPGRSKQVPKRTRKETSQAKDATWVGAQEAGRGPEGSGGVNGELCSRGGRRKA